MGSNYSGSVLQGKDGYQEVQLLWSHVASYAWNEGGGNCVGKNFIKIVTIDERQFGFMPESRTVDAVFVLRRMQEEYRARGKMFCMHFVVLEKAFDRVQRKVL